MGRFLEGLFGTNLDFAQSAKCLPSPPPSLSHQRQRLGTHVEPGQDISTHWIFVCYELVDEKDPEGCLVCFSLVDIQISALENINVVFQGLTSLKTRVISTKSSRFRISKSIW